MKVITILTAVAGCIAFALSPRGTTTESGGIGGAGEVVIDPLDLKVRAISGSGGSDQPDLNIQTSGEISFVAPPTDADASSKRHGHSSEGDASGAGKALQGGSEFANGGAIFVNGGSRSGMGVGQGSGGSGGGGASGKSAAKGKDGGGTGGPETSPSADAPETEKLADATDTDPLDDSTDDALPPADSDVTAVAIVAVPEPSTALFGLALTAAVGFARRRSSTRAA
jgi:hypothetical protein